MERDSPYDLNGGMASRARQKAERGTSTDRPAVINWQARAEALAAVVEWWNDVEARAADAHTIYQTEARRRGDVRHKDDYCDLDEPTKEWDRVLVRWVRSTFADPAPILSAVRRDAAAKALEDASKRAASRPAESVARKDTRPDVYTAWDVVAEWLSEYAARIRNKEVSIDA